MQSTDIPDSNLPDVFSARDIPSITVNMLPDDLDAPQRRDDHLLLVRTVAALVDTKARVFSADVEEFRSSCLTVLRNYVKMHSAAEMQRKDSRTPADTISLATFDHADDLWFDDANLIVHAGLSIFRVYRGMLAEQSPLLADMLGAPKLSTYDVFQGCPVLVLPHNATDVGHLLSAIFKPNSFDPYLTNISFDAIAAVFRLSTAYQIPGLPRKALTLLSSAYPTSLAEFAAAGFNPSYCRDQILPVIQFAREHSIVWILPLAFYRYCLEITGRTLMHGVEYDDAQVVLSRDDQQRCYDAEKVMHTHHGRAVLERYATRVGDAGCTGGAACRSSRLDEGAMLLPRVLEAIPNILLSWAPQPDSQLCPACLEDMRQWDLTQRQSVWDRLPALFDLPDWTALNQQKDAALALWEAEDDEAITF